MSKLTEGQILYLSKKYPLEKLSINAGDKIWVMDTHQDWTLLKVWEIVRCRNQDTQGVCSFCCGALNSNEYGPYCSTWRNFFNLPVPVAIGRLPDNEEVRTLMLLGAL
jgi:hypothetical protein